RLARGRRGAPTCERDRGRAPAAPNPAHGAPLIMVVLPGDRLHRAVPAITRSRAWLLGPLSEAQVGHVLAQVHPGYERLAPWDPRRRNAAATFVRSPSPSCPPLRCSSVRAWCTRASRFSTSASRGLRSKRWGGSPTSA